MSNTINLAEIAWIIKNLRGVLYLKEVNEERLNFLSKKFRYRNIGIPPTLTIKEKKPFIKLIYPSKTIEEFILSFKNPAIESISLASCYVSPVIAFLEDYKDLKPFAIEEVKIEDKLTDKELKRHLRIADYAVIDIYHWSTNFAYECLKKGDIENMIEKRRERVKQDIKRYWRISKEQGRAFIAYLDLADFIAKHLEIKKLEPLKATLSIVTAVLVI